MSITLYMSIHLASLHIAWTNFATPKDNTNKHNIWLCIKSLPPPKPPSQIPSLLTRAIRSAILSCGTQSLRYACANTIYPPLVPPPRLLIPRSTNNPIKWRQICKHSTFLPMTAKMQHAAQFQQLVQRIHRGKRWREMERTGGFVRICIH